ncbi:hypothetical protein KIW84_041281 [Lathyrus oleraceus]|uniref:Uncharacterized protein n=1 Tax=Pisum sativum TaxID=3888 RepID=A0A9D4X7N4_PEA|nr:hypothetical protein KIW84_041281 [Pisum sativum]
MSYAYERLMYVVVAEPSSLPNQDVEEFEDAFTKIKQERDLWEERFQALNQKQEELQLDMPQPSGAWKKIVDQLVLEKAQMKTSFEFVIQRIRTKYATIARSSDIIARDP